jgi:hypothetical protein
MRLRKGGCLQHALEAQPVESFVKGPNVVFNRHVFGCHDSLVGFSSNDPGLQLVRINGSIDGRFRILYDSMSELYD